MFNISSKYFSIFNDKPPGSWASHTTTDFLTCYPCSYHSSMGLRTNMLTFQRGLCANVPACQRASTCFNLACQFFKLACQRVERRTNFSSISLMLYYYKKFYIILDIMAIHIICICIHKNCFKLYFYISCHIKEKWMGFFNCYHYYSFLFLS